MKSALGRVFFWITWPLLWFYTPLRLRARVLLVCNKEFLVVKPYYSSGAWQLPGGGIKAGESAATAAARELREETGIQVDKPKMLLGVGVFRESGLIFRYSLFYARIPAKKALSHQKNEIVSSAWLPLKNGDKTLPAHIVSALRIYGGIK